MRLIYIKFKKKLWFLFSVYTRYGLITIKVAHLNQKEFIFMMSRHHAISAPPLFRTHTVTSTVTDHISIVISSL